MAKIKKINFIKEGNRLHKKVERILKAAGFTILQSDMNAKGPDIIATFGPHKLIVQCKHSPQGKQFNKLDHEVDSYAHKVKRFGADRAVLAFSGYKHKKISEKNLEEWLKNDKVAIWTDSMVSNYKTLTQRIGIFSAYQILGDLQITSRFDEDKRFPAVRVTQNKEKFYLTSLPPRFLLKAAYVARRSQRGHFYQRYLKARRVKEQIPEYIEGQSGLFPNNLILASSRPLQFDNNKLKLPSAYAYLWVLDGQHRLYSFSNVKNSKLLDSFTLPCAIFDNRDIDRKDQALIFVKINTEAQKIRSSLIDELAESFNFDFHRREISIRKYLEKTRYFKNRIKKYSSKGSIDSTTFVTTKGFVDLVSDSGLILRKHKLLTEQAKINLCVSYFKFFFASLYGSFRKEWEKPREFILSNGKGYRALMYLMKKILKYTDCRKDRRIYREIFKALKNGNPLIRNSDTKRKYAGEAGAKDLADEWARTINIRMDSFDTSVNPTYGDIVGHEAITTGDRQCAEEFLKKWGVRLKGAIRAELMSIDATTLPYIKSFFPNATEVRILFQQMKTDDKTKIDHQLTEMRSHGKKVVLTKYGKLHERWISSDEYCIELSTDLKADAIANTNHKKQVIKLKGEAQNNRFDARWKFCQGSSGKPIVFDWSKQKEESESPN